MTVNHFEKGEKIMKKSVVLTALLIAILPAVWVVFKPVTPSPLGTGNNYAPVPAQEEMLTSAQSGGAAVPVTGKDFKVAPVFDTTGAIVSDPTGTILNDHRMGGATVPVTGADFKVAPVFDTTGAIMSDPSGTLLSVIDR
jgi:hypothetical protein